ncbi:MAG: HIT family protein [Candidatus Aenigmarchaeota archaeon]|nr:HIT family protein [Candidatus Aenigmarchaeota archaeon]
MDCLFCSIISGKIPALKVAEDGRFLAFLDISPSSRGHTVIIPKKHYASLLDMPLSEAEGYFGFIYSLSSQVMSAMGTDACNIGANVGKIAGQEVQHVHFHIIPRYAGDGGESVQAIVKMPFRKEDLPQIAEKIRAFSQKSPP